MGKTNWKTWPLVALIFWVVALVIEAANAIIGFVKLYTHTMNDFSSLMLAISGVVAVVFMVFAIVVFYAAQLNPHIKLDREKKDHHVEAENTTQE